MNQPPVFHRRLSALFLAVLILTLLVGSAGAQSKVFNWEEWHSDITLLENGDLRIEETQTLNFQGEPFTFGYRSIDTGVAGGNDGITDISLREGDRVYEQSNSRAPGTFRVSTDGEETRIDWYFEPAVGRHTYTFSYTVKGGVNVGTLEEGSGDQIFWKVIPGDHPAYVNASSATVTLPPGVAPQQYTGTTDYLVAAYTNGQERDDVAISVSADGRTITYINDTPLLPDDTFEVRVQFPHGLLPIPVPAWQQQMQTADTISLALLGLALFTLVAGPLGVFLLWYLRGRDPELTTVVPTYISEPPSNLPPALVGTLLDEQADMQDIVSTQIDLAHRGYLTMTETKKDFTFERTDKPDDDLRPFEKRYLEDIFGNDTEVKLNSLRYEFADNLPHLRDMLYKEMVSEGLFHGAPDSVRRSYGCLAGGLLGLAGLAFGVLSILAGEGVGTLLCLPLAVGVTAIAMFIAARAMPKKTPAGVEAAAKWEAFKAYLQTIEKHDDLAESGAIFEEYLAYATAFGIEKSWIKKFAAVPSTPIPTWYHPYPPILWGHGGVPSGGGLSGGGTGGGGVSMPSLEGMSKGTVGGLAAMSVGLTRMLNSTSTVLQSTPPSSSSGGSSGGFSGGFSGGGFSGGGGSAGFG